MSRARGAKAQRKTIQHFQTQTENTINFTQALKTQLRQVELVPKSRNQEQLILKLNDANQHIVVAVGPAGTGKTYLAMQAAIKALKTGQCERIVLTRPAVSVEDERHGFLPGDIISKMEPWTRPLLDVLREYYRPQDIVRMMDDQIIEISPLAYMRGRSLKDAWIVADEMQNATPNQMLMLMTRIGNNSKIVITGDVEQTDRRKGDNGLIDLVDRLKRDAAPGLSLCQFDTRDVQRHRIINTVLSLYNDM